MLDRALLLYISSLFFWRCAAKKPPVRNLLLTEGTRFKPSSFYRLAVAVAGATLLAA